MRKIREVLRLKWECKLTNRETAQSCSISPSTVSNYIIRAQKAGLSWPLPEDLDDKKLYELLFPTSAKSSNRTIPQPEWSLIHTELRKKSVTLRLLWFEYRENYPEGYSYSQFCARYQQWAKSLKPSMRIPHKGGEKLFVDYAGQTVPVIDSSTGEIREAQIFVAVLGASSYTYAEAQWSQKLQSWINGHIRAFTFFGGVPEIVVPDNLKSGVAKPCRYEPDINPTYHDLARHYGTVVLPARIRKPKDKAKAEVGVQVVERWILARVRNRKFYSLAGLNQTIHKLLQELNNRQMQHLGKSRRQLYEMLDRPALKPLPQLDYEFALWKKARVNIDYHVEYKKHFYSVPYNLIRKEVYIRATEHTVEIFYNNQRVASHPRLNTQGRFSTISEHMPVAHRKYSEWSPERFLSWAKKMGPCTVQLIEKILISRQHPQQSYRSCMGILDLAKRYSDTRLEAACKRALPAGIRSYKGIRNILDAKLDQIELDEPGMGPPASHANVRGGRYYQAEESSERDFSHAHTTTS